MENRKIHETIGPANWEELKRFGHTMVDDLVNFLHIINENSGLEKRSGFTGTILKEDLPLIGKKAEELYTDFKELIFSRYQKGIHQGNRSQDKGLDGAQSMLTGMLTSALNLLTLPIDRILADMEKQVIEWCRNMIQFPSGAIGALLNDISAANTAALLAARNSIHYLIQSRGVKVYLGKLVVYASAEAHSSIRKAAELMGIGGDAVRKVRVDDSFSMDLKHLEQLILKDETDGNIPLCIVATVGTMNSGGIDPLEMIYRICRHKKIWFHIDGSFGALMRSLPEFEDQMRWMSKADSISFDLQKFLYLSHGLSGVFVKDVGKHNNVFAAQQYVPDHEKGMGRLAMDLGIGAAPAFKTLNVWMTLRGHGMDKFQRWFRQNIEQAKWLEEQIRKRPELELMAPSMMNIVCFRFNPDQLAEWELSRLNKEIVMQLHEGGITKTSAIRLNNQYCIRVEVITHQSVWEDFGILLNEVIRIGESLNSGNREYIADDYLQTA